MVQRSVIIHLLRLISPHPWGSVRADANRRTHSIKRAMHNIFRCNAREKFIIGAEVLWTPLIIKSGRQGYLLSRAKPFSNGASLSLDITNQLRMATAFELLYDNRFLIRVQSPAALLYKLDIDDKILIQPDSKYNTPIILLRRRSQEDTILRSIYPQNLGCPDMAIEFTRPLEI